MSRTTLCVLTAAGLAALSVGAMIARRQVLGDEVRGPGGPGTWKVTMRIKGQTEAGARLLTLTPLDFGRQHVLRESCASKQLLGKLPEARHPERRHVVWAKRSEVADGPFHAEYQFSCSIGHGPTAPMSQLAKTLYAAPKPGEHLDLASPAGSDDPAVSDQARRLTAGVELPTEQALALYHFVDGVANEPNRGRPPARPAECLQAGGGDAASKARLLLALLRNRGLPARLVVGLALPRGHEQLAHTWVEAWVDDRWLSLCPFYHHFGKVPPAYLVFGFGDIPLVRGRHVRDLDHAFLVERPGEEAAADVPPLRRALRAVSFYMLPPQEQQLVEYLLLLPIAALIICVFRNLIGLPSFGTFAPALVGLAFHNLHSLPGLPVFVAIVLLGWVMRRVLGHYHLLQVPRTAVMLSLVVVVLIAAIVLANFRELHATQYVALFPMVILTGMIERFWTLETEDSTTSSFRTLLSTVFIAGTIALVLSLRPLVDHMFRYPETLGVIVAGQLLLGRYTGYRLSELFRFRDFLRRPPELRLPRSV
jgi:hypothetical protein